MIVNKDCIGRLKEIDYKAGAAIMIDKPLEWTSFNVVSKVRYILTKHYKQKKFKVGHAGTLDPLASGLLILCVGQWTKKATEFQDLGKAYSGKIGLGATTPSYDLESEVDETFPVDHIDARLLERARKEFVGDLIQVPPVFSAKQIDGKRAYELARKGKEVKMRPNAITIHQLELDATHLPDLGFHVKCSKGTYIRSLAYDLGKALESGGHLTELRREAIGEYRVDDALSIKQFESEIKG